jgi:hypothetical protein
MVGVAIALPLVKIGSLHIRTGAFATPNQCCAAYAVLRPSSAKLLEMRRHW